MSKVSELLVSSKSNLWRTPPDLFSKLNAIFKFTVDACADEENHLCDVWSKDVLLDFGLPRYKLPSESMWANTPYGKAVGKQLGQADIVKILLMYAIVSGSGLMLLLPVRTGTKLWQETIFLEADFVHFIQGRLKFLDCNGNKQGPATFDSALVGINYSQAQISWLSLTIPGFLVDLRKDRDDGL